MCHVRARENVESRSWCVGVVVGVFVETVGRRTWMSQYELKNWWSDNWKGNGEVRVDERVSVPFRPTQISMDWPGIERGSPRLEAADWRLDLYCEVEFVMKTRARVCVCTAVVYSVGNRGLSVEYWWSGSYMEKLIDRTKSCPVGRSPRQVLSGLAWHWTWSSAMRLTTCPILEEWCKCPS
jgi:hypothetical protein